LYYIGFDLGSSSVKVAIVDAATGTALKTLHEPPNEMEIISVRTDWAEQDPEDWWHYVCRAPKRILKETAIDPSKITGIGISYQMHGLVVVDIHGNPLRNSIIWCDSRATGIGAKAFDDLGHEKCTDHLLNSPGNFTASKLKWVKENEPGIYDKVYKYMLPGDYIAYKLTGTICTTKNGLSEGILWDYKDDKVADWLLDYFGIDTSLTPDIVENFTNQGVVSAHAANETGLAKGIPVVYRAGDQPNNALSLQVFKPGEVAATGGTSGVLYAITATLKSKESLRINNFSHVNYSKKEKNLGKLLCINGCGIMYRWLRDTLGVDSYEEMNMKAAEVPIGSDGLVLLPFGNGAERMLNNKNIGVHLANLNLNQHHSAHLCRAALEGIAFSFVYGMEILKNDNATIDVIRAGNDNLFRSEIFSRTLATLTGHEIEIYNTTGAIGAARAVGLKNGNFDAFAAHITKNDHVMTFVPHTNRAPYIEAYQLWKKELEFIVKK